MHGIEKPHAWVTIEELDENDKEHLHREASHRWRHPRMLYFLIVLSSIGAAVQGWDQTGKANTEIISAIMPTRQREPWLTDVSTGSNGANLSWPMAFGIPDSGSVCTAAGTCEKNSWLYRVC